MILDLWFGGRASGWDLLEALHVTPGARFIPVMICFSAPLMRGWCSAKRTG